MVESTDPARDVGGAVEEEKAKEKKEAKEKTRTYAFKAPMV